MQQFSNDSSEHSCILFITSLLLNNLSCRLVSISLFSAGNYNYTYCSTAHCCGTCVTLGTNIIYWKGKLGKHHQKTIGSLIQNLILNLFCYLKGSTFMLQIGSICTFFKFNHLTLNHYFWKTDCMIQDVRLYNMYFYVQPKPPSFPSPLQWRIPILTHHHTQGTREEQEENKRQEK